MRQVGQLPRISNQPSVGRGVKAGHSGYDARGLQVIGSIKTVGSDDDCDDVRIAL